MSIDITPTTILAPFEAEHEAVNLTRNNKGSAWNRIGNNKLISADQWRYNYNPDSGIFEGRTIMGQWTNEILDPRDMTTANWTNQTTVTRDQVGIDGQANTACLIKDDSATNNDRSRASTITVADDSATHTVHALVHKTKGTSNEVSFFVRLTGGTTGVFTGFDVDIANGTSPNATVEDAGDWWNISFQVANNGTGNTSFVIDFYPVNLSDNSLTGSAVLGYIGMFKDRSSPPPTPVYGEVAGQSYTQDPDMPDVSTLSDIDYNTDENTFSIEFNPAYSEGTLFDLHTDGNNRIYARRNVSNEIHLVIVDGGTTQADLNLGTIADNTDGKIAVGWKENNIAGCLNGGTVQTDTSATIPAVSTLHIGRNYNNTNYWDAFIGSKLNYPRKLTNSQIQDESK